MSKKAELAKNTLIIAIGKMSTQLVTFLLLPLYTIFLSPSEYGLIDLIAAYVTLLVPIITLQFEMAAFRFLIDARGDDSKKAKIISNIIITLIIALTLSVLIAITLKTFVNIRYFELIIINIIVSSFSTVSLQIARGLGKNKQFSIASILTGATTLFSAIILVVYFNMGINGVLLSTVAANAVCAIYLFTKLGLKNYIQLNMLNKKIQKALIHYSLPLVPNGIALWAINVSDRTIITIIIGLAANGIYAVANKFALILGAFANILTMSWTESVSQHINAKDRNEFISETLNSCLNFFISIGTLLVAVAPVVFSLLISQKYNEAINYIPIIIAGVILSTIMSLYGAIYIAMKLTKQIAGTSIIAATINIILTVIMVPTLGLYGASIATTTAFAFVATFRHFDLKKYIIIKYDIRRLSVLSALFIIVSLIQALNQPIINILNILIAIIILFLVNKNQLKHLIKTAQQRVARKARK